MLSEMYEIPEGFLTAKAEELYTVLKAPTLFHLEGVKSQPLFISTLLHGNETTGLYAIQRLLKKYSGKQLPRAVSVFVGNIEAAKENQRRLDHQDDYNRIWPGTLHRDSAEKDMMQTVARIMRKKKPFASIDIHNNTGKNPHYACINNLNPHGLVLASEFSDIAVYFTSPKGVQSSAFSDFCPATVLECGQSGDRSGEDHALNYLENILALDDLSSPLKHKLKLHHTIARVTLLPTVTLGIDAGQSGLNLNALLEENNFQLIAAGTEFASVSNDIEKFIVVSSESNEDVTDEYIERADHKLLFKKPVILSMFTTCETAMRQDCICYFMEELHIG